MAKNADLHDGAPAHGNVLLRATEVFESEAAARSWLETPSGALGEVTPLSLLDSAHGRAAVLQLLGRIEHGVFS